MLQQVVLWNDGDVVGIADEGDLDVSLYAARSDEDIEMTKSEFLLKYPVGSTVYVSLIPASLVSK